MPRPLLPPAAPGPSRARLRRPSSRLVNCLLAASVLSACTAASEELGEPTPQLTAPQTALAAPTTAAAELLLSGEIVADGNRTARVFPRVGGQVVSVGAELGDAVRRGQVLAVLKSNEIANLQNQHTTGTADLAVARKNLSVAEELLRAGLAAEQDVYKARVEVARAQGNATNNLAQLQVYRVSRNGLYELRAPLAGYITEKKLAAGLRFSAANVEAAFTVANLDSVWVMANVFEADLARVHRGQAVEITTLSYPDRPLHGRIDQLFHLLDQESKAMKVRCTLPNPDHLLKPGMHAQVRVLAKPSR